jgi:transcriptional regulator with XRE-family HTH domain
MEMTNVIHLDTWAPPSTFAARMREVRVEYGRRVEEKMGQEKFAGIIGVGVKALGAWEAGINEPADLDALCLKVERRVGADAEYLAGHPLPTGPRGGDRASLKRKSSSACTRSGGNVITFPSVGHSDLLPAAA